MRFDLDGELCAADILKEHKERDGDVTGQTPVRIRWVIRSVKNKRMKGVMSKKVQIKITGNGMGGWNHFS
jgi:hypothetical protein